MNLRIGNGMDVHGFTDDPTRPLILGGVMIPDAQGLAGHSDADVIIHAVIDALLGAAALGDLGSLVGVDLPETRGMASTVFLKAALKKLEQQHFSINNVDATVIAQTPRLSPHVPVIRASLSRLLGVTRDRVSVKATTTDRLGFIGDNQGMACLAVATVLHLPNKTP